MAQPAPLPLRRPPDARRAAPSNLPAQLTSFLGRDAERAEIAAVLRESSRLVTLTGAGGVGKTRLALEVASDLVFDFADGVWLVELAPMTEARRVLPSIAETLGIQEEPGQDLADTLVAALRSRHLLLVLDNCEHLIDTCAEIAHRLLSASRRLTVLATSREPLNVTGETVWRVPSLEQPISERLFVDRAAAAQRGFAVSADAGARISQICQQLDGIPLALELAAARVPALGVDQIATRLDDRFRILVSGSRTAPRRQQTLRAVVEWSYDLLADDERDLFASLSIFAGGWSLGAAESICATDADVLARLVTKSLVIAEETSSGTWYRMLDTMRAYAAEKLRASGKEAELRARHLAWYTELAESAEHVMRRADAVPWSARVGHALRLRHEMDNLRAAWQWSLEGGDVEVGMRLGAGLFPYFYSQGFLAEGRQWLQALLERTADAPPTQARLEVLSAAVKLAAHHGDDATAERLAAEVDALPHDVRSSQSWVDVESGMSIALLLRGDVRAARQRATRCRELAVAECDRVTAGLALTYLGEVAVQDGALEEAAGLYQQAYDELHAMDFQLGEAMALDGLAGLAQARGKPAEARGLYEAALSIFDCMDATLQSGQVHLGLGATALAEGDPARAARHFGQAAELLAAVGQRALLARALDGLAGANQALASQSPAHSGAEHALTERELQVARLVGRGLTNREIGNELVISVRTADRHVENILAKLGFSSRVAIAAWAAHNGLDDKMGTASG